VPRRGGRVQRRAPVPAREVRVRARHQQAVHGAQQAAARRQPQRGVARRVARVGAVGPRRQAPPELRAEVQPGRLGETTS
jgi:hypothetical protein